MNFVITDTLANAVLAYLQTKPYQEVAKLISELAQIKPVKEEKHDVAISNPDPA